MSDRTTVDAPDPSPTLTAPMRPVRVSWDGGDEETPIFDGFTAGATWNGFVCPYFTKEVADQIAAECNAVAQEYPDCETVTYDPERDAYALDRADYDDGPDYVYGQFAASIGQTVYPIGAFGWTWTEVEPEP
jgi:hypothetical protein